jgi:hypothetical protein
VENDITKKGIQLINNMQKQKFHAVGVVSKYNRKVVITETGGDKHLFMTAYAPVCLDTSTFIKQLYCAKPSLLVR